MLSLSLTSAWVLGFVAFISILFVLRRRAKNIPKGPVGWPIVGNLMQLGKFPHLKLYEWANEFGPIFSFKMGKNLVITISDPQLIKEAFNDPRLSGRPDVEMFNIMAGGKNGIISSDGQAWMEQRRFLSRYLRDFVGGFGRQHIQDLIMTEVNEYLSWLKSTEGRSVSVTRQFNLAILNLLWMIIAGKRYRHNDVRLARIFEQHSKVLQEMTNSPIIFMPKFAKLIPRLSGWNKFISLIKSSQNVNEEAIEEHRRNFKEEANPHDFIDSYLLEIHSTKDPKSSFYKEVGDASLRAVVSDLFSAGSDSTALILSWSILYLCKFPHVQKKLQKELDVVVGKNRQPSLLDRPNLPYCEATLAEVLRMSSIFPIGVFHKLVASDMKLEGYDIPEGAWIVGNQYHLHYREDIWNEPQVFKPERHLINNGMTLKKHDALMPFSIGKRACLGEALARDVLFLFFANIFQRFLIQLDDSSAQVPLDPKPGFLLAPQDFKIIVKDRI